MGMNNYVSVLEDEYVEYSKWVFEKDNKGNPIEFDEDIIRKGLEAVKRWVVVPTRANFFFYPDVENKQFWLEWRFGKSREGMMLVVKENGYAVHRSDKPAVIGEAWKLYDTLEEISVDEYIYDAFLTLNRKEYES